MVSQQFAKLRPRKGSCGFEPHTLRHIAPSYARGFMITKIDEKAATERVSSNTRLISKSLRYT